MVCDHYQSPPFPLHSLVNFVHLLTARAKWNACWYLHWAWSLKSERGRCYDSWMRVLLGLLTLVLLPAPKIDFLHCANGPYLAVWCLCYLSTVGSFSPFQRCFLHFIFTNRATRIESNSSTWGLKTKALHKLRPLKASWPQGDLLDS